MGENQTTGAPKSFRPDPFAYHEIVDLEVTTLTNRGHGLARHNNWVILVPFALPGESVRARIYRNHSNFSEADHIEFLRPSPRRVPPVCELFTRCGGCQYQNLAYSEQLSWKRRQVEELLLHMAKVAAPVNEVIASPRQYAYRSKITPHFQKPRSGKITDIGFLRVGNRQRILDVPRCPIASDTINEALAPLRDRVRKNAADYRRGATLLLRDSDEGVITNPNKIAHESVGDISFDFGAGDFFQNHPHILPAFTGHVGAEASREGERYLADAYCGSGLFALTAAHRFEKVIGIEINESAVAQARANARRNAITNASFICGGADAIFSDFQYPASETSVVIDPPRKGSDEAFLTQLLAFGPKTIVYVSCNPATQIRDLTTLLANDAYTIKTVQPFDLFTQTAHLECVVTLSKGC